MPTLRDWEDYVDMEEQYDIEETRKKVQHKKPIIFCLLDFQIDKKGHFLGILMYT